MTEPHRTDAGKLSGFSASLICQSLLIALLASFFAPLSGLLEVGSASAQTSQLQSRHSQYRQLQKIMPIASQHASACRSDSANRVVRKKKPSFFGGLFASKPQKAQRRQMRQMRQMRRPKTIKPLFGGFKIKIPGVSYQRPAVSRANYERRMRAAPRRGFAPGGVRSYAPVRDGARGRSIGENAGSRRSARGGGRGKYRTMCVRLCDGYYFPVSFKTGSSRFDNDEKRCNSECYNAPTKLFYYSNPGGSIDNMRTLDGLRYRNLANAFKYRKEFVADCRCKVEPWSRAGKAATRKLGARQTGSIAGRALCGA